MLDDDDFAKSVAAGTSVMMMNSGQSCNAPSRMLVPNSRMDEAIAVAREAAGAVTVGDPNDKTAIGPVASKAQFDKIQGLIQKGIDEGATARRRRHRPAGRRSTRATSSSRRCSPTSPTT